MKELRSFLAQAAQPATKDVLFGSVLTGAIPLTPKGVFISYQYWG